MLSYLTMEELKDGIKKLEKDEKSLKKGGVRKYFFSAEYVPVEKVYDYLRKQNSFVREMLQKEKAECLSFLIDEEEVKKAGWYNKKQDPKKLLAWADKAYPQRKIELFELMFEKQIIVQAMKNLKKKEQ